MSTSFDALEQQLNTLRPARLPATARQHILQEMGRPVPRRESTSWLFGHRTGLQVALAGVLSLALVVGWHWLPPAPGPASSVDQVTLAVGNALLPSLAVWQTRLAAAYPMSENTVAVLHSPSTLTNIQVGR